MKLLIKIYLLFALLIITSCTKKEDASPFNELPVGYLLDNGSFIHMDLRSYKTDSSQIDETIQLRYLRTYAVKQDSVIKVYWPNAISPTTSSSLHLKVKYPGDTDPEIFYWAISYEGTNFSNLSMNVIDPASPKPVLSNIVYDPLTFSYSGNIEWHFANDSLHLPDSTHLKAQFKIADIREYVE
jgi:hypothetical protein